MEPLASQPSSAAPIDRDVLITRLLDGRAGSMGWRSFKHALPADGQLIDDIIDTASDQEALQAAITPHTTRAASMTLEMVRHAAPATLPFQVSEPHHADQADRPHRGTSSKLAGKAGWAVAACLGLMLLGVIVRQTAGPLGGPIDGSSGASPQAAGIGGLNLANLSSEQLIDKYVKVGQQEGKVVSMLPQFIVLESRPVSGSDGRTAGHEVLYVRQVLERAIVDDVYRLGKSDTGQAVLVPASMPNGVRPGKL
jgi:hypothetical protein